MPIKIAKKVVNEELDGEKKTHVTFEIRRYNSRDILSEMLFLNPEEFEELKLKINQIK
jgi:hypothetical protein